MTRNKVPIINIFTLSGVLSRVLLIHFPIAQGDHPYPTRFIITSKLIADGPQYIIQTSDWKIDDAVKAVDVSFKNAINASKIDLKNIGEMNEVPKNFTSIRLFSYRQQSSQHFS